MIANKDVSVAVLLATHNGALFVEPQIRSLAANATVFTLHWLDDHSTDSTRNIVRSAASASGIGLEEWHQPDHLGVPGAFFALLEKVEADIYLFCDQDDIWEPAKIDATVENLRADLNSPVLCFSELMMFKDGQPQIRYRLFDVFGTQPEKVLEESRLFMTGAVAGNTQGFTRALRDIFLRHKEVANTFAFMHDTWMHIIATATGTVRFLNNVPTTLYRVHGGNVSGTYCSWRGLGRGRLGFSWQQHQRIRKVMSRQAEGFMIAAGTLPPGPRLERCTMIAKSISTLCRRQSAGDVSRLMRERVMWPNWRLSFALALVCFWSDATA